MATHQEAETRVERGFLIHLAVFILVVGGLFALNYSRNPDQLWSAWVAGGWGIGVILHGAAVHLFPERRERMIERTERRMDQRAGV
jgi:hypothetical protein